MPMAGKNRKELRISLPPQPSSWNSALNVETRSHKQASVTIAGSSCVYDVKLNDNEARAIRGEHSECFDEFDLVSECSSPSSYTPGKYLQLCDIEPSDVMDDITLFAGSCFQSSANDLDEVSLLGYQHLSQPALDSSYSLRNTIQESTLRSRTFTIVSNKTLLVMGLCVVVAMTALGCLTTVI